MKKIEMGAKKRREKEIKEGKQEQQKKEAQGERSI